MMIQQWHTQCAVHETCRDELEHPFPSRLLDLEPEDSLGGPVKLIETKQLNSSKYACLSYCWGGVEPDCMTTNATYDKNQRGIPTQKTPRLFLEAKEVTRNMGIRYLWIDSLCIIQGNSLDWRQEAARMADI